MATVDPVPWAAPTRTASYVPSPDPGAAVPWPRAVMSAGAGCCGCSHDCVGCDGLCGDPYGPYGGGLPDTLYLWVGDKGVPYGHPPAGGPWVGVPPELWWLTLAPASPVVNTAVGGGDPCYPVRYDPRNGPVAVPRVSACEWRAVVAVADRPRLEDTATIVIRCEGWATVAGTAPGTTRRMAEFTANVWVGPTDAFPTLTARFALYGPDGSTTPPPPRDCSQPLDLAATYPAVLTWPTATAGGFAAHLASAPPPGKVRNWAWWDRPPPGCLRLTVGAVAVFPASGFCNAILPAWDVAGDHDLTPVYCPDFATPDPDSANVWWGFVEGGTCDAPVGGGWTASVFPNGVCGGFGWHLGGVVIRPTPTAARGYSVDPDPASAVTIDDVLVSGGTLPVVLQNSTAVVGCSFSATGTLAVCPGGFLAAPPPRATSAARPGGAPPGTPTLGEWEYVTAARLAADTQSLLATLPPDVDLVVGCVRSGLVPAALVAAGLHAPLRTVSRRTGVLDAGAGHRMAGRDDGRPPGHVLVVDDTAAGGHELRAVRPLVERAYPGAKVSTAVVYCHPRAASLVDFFHALYPGQHYLEWNWANAGHGSACCYDFDGILCEECPPADDDDGPRYRRFLRTARPLHLPRRKPVHTVVTGRHVRYEGETRDWLARYGLSVEHLVMRHWAYPPDPAARIEALARYKAEHYRISRLPLMAESEPAQAERIAALAGKPVLCPAAGRVFPGAEPGREPAACLFRSAEPEPHAVAHGQGLSPARDWYRCGWEGKVGLLVTPCRGCGVDERRRCGPGCPGYNPSPADG